MLQKVKNKILEKKVMFYVLFFEILLGGGIMLSV